MVDLTHVNGSEPFDFSHWKFGFGDEQDSKLVEEIRDGLQDMLAQDPPSASLPVVWEAYGDIVENPVEDPLTIAITLPIGKDGDGPVWRFTVAALLDDYLEISDLDHGLSTGEVKIHRAIATKLRNLADLIDQDADRRQINDD